MYNFGYKINNTNCSNNLKFTENAAKYRDIVQRIWKFKVISNDNFINVIIGGCNTDMVNGPQFNVVLLGNTNYYVSHQTSGAATNILNGTFYNISDTSDMNGYNFLNQFNFYLPNQTTQIKRTKSLVLSSDSLLIDNINGMCDCSAVPSSQTLTIGNKQYYSINDKTLIPIS